MSSLQYPVYDTRVGAKVGHITSEGVVRTSDKQLRDAVQSHTDDTGSLPVRLPEDLRKDKESVTWVEPGDEDYLFHISKLLTDRYEIKILLEKDEWVSYEGPRGGDGWQHTSTGEVRYTDDPPSSASSDEDSDPDMNSDVDSGSPVDFDDGKIEDGRLLSDPDSLGDIEVGDEITVSNSYIQDYMTVEAIGPEDDDIPGSLPEGQLRARLEGIGSYSFGIDDITGHVVDYTEDIGDYDVRRGTFEAELADKLLSEEGLDSIPVREIQDNIPSVESVDLLLDAVRNEKNTRNSATAVDALMERLRDLGIRETDIQRDTAEEHNTDLPEDYPGGDYDTALDELEDTDFASLFVGEGLANRDAVSRIEDHISTERLEEYVTERAELRDFPSTDITKGLWWGILAAREDSDWDIKDTVRVKSDRETRFERLPGTKYNKTGMLLDTQNAIDSMTNIEAGKTLARLESMRAEDVDDYSGVYYDSIYEIVNDSSSYASSTTTAVHEFGHAWHYATGVSGVNGRNNVISAGEDPDEWNAHFTTSDDASEYAKNLADDLQSEWNRYKERFKEHGQNAEIREYQRTNANEFMAVSFAHYVDDTAKLREFHPELELLYDEYIGGGVKSEELDTITGLKQSYADEDEDADMPVVDAKTGDRVSVVLETNEEITNGEITDITTTESGEVDRYTLKLGPERYSLEPSEIQQIERHS